VRRRLAALALAVALAAFGAGVGRAVPGHHGPAPVAAGSEWE
jgi:hypothetical protein